jgi:hypothetical protein
MDKGLLQWANIDKSKSTVTNNSGRFVQRISAPGNCPYFGLGASFSSCVWHRAATFIGCPVSSSAKSTVHHEFCANAGKSDRCTSTNPLEIVVTPPLVKHLRHPFNAGQGPICLASNNDLAHS